MLLLASLLLTPATRAMPDRVAASLEAASSTSIGALVTFNDRAVAAILAGDGSLRVIDTETWETEILFTCDEPQGLTGWEDSDSDLLRLVVGCASGEVEEVQIDSDHNVSAQGAVDLGLGAIVDLVAFTNAADGEPEIWVAVDDVQLYQIDADSLSVPTDGLESSLNANGLEELFTIGSYVLALHGGDDISRVDTSTGNAALTTENVGSRDFVDVALWGSSGVYLADSNQGGVVRYLLSGGTNNDFQILLDDEDGFSSVVALGIDTYDTDDSWLAAADADLETLRFYTFDAVNGGVGDVLLDELDVSAYSGVSWLEPVEGYLLAGSSSGELLVVTERPWVTVSGGPGDTSLLEGEDFTLSFSSDLGGDWSLLLGGVDGEELASGSFEADESASVDVSVDETWAEGNNRLVVVVDKGGLVGSAGTTVSVDNPPPVVTGFTLGVGASKLYVSFEGISDEDLERYDVYISTEAFSADGWATGGPDYVGDDGITSPISLSDYTPGEAVETTISGLTNGVTYFVGVRAVDANGTEGDMSDVLSAAPTNTLGAADLANDPGGFGCAGAGGAASGLLALGAAALLSARRRRVASLAVLLTVGLTASSSPAHAADDGRVKGHRDDAGGLVLDRSTELRVGGTTLSDSALTQVYGSSGLYSLDLEMGVQLLRFFEVDAGLGLVRDSGYLLGEDTGLATTEKGKLSLVPLSLQGTLRLDLFDGMPIVPYGSLGLDYWLWRERKGDIAVTELLNQDAVMGDKVGYHYALGANVLLDWMDPKHASLSRARFGIHDSYLTVDVAWNRMLEDNGLSFDSRAVTVGFKFDH